jgi:hypothetical protein
MRGGRLNDNQIVVPGWVGAHTKKGDFFLLQMDDFFAEGLCFDNRKEGEGERRVGAPSFCEGQSEGRAA